MIDPIRLRWADAEDVLAITRLINAAFGVERFFIDGDRTSAAEIHRMLIQGGFLLAEDDAFRLYGCVYVERRGGRHERGYFGMLAVDPERQRGGIGRGLIAAAEDQCRACGCTVMEIQVVNLRAELPPLYRRLGYTETGTAPFPAAARPKLPCHFVQMEKPLAPGGTPPKVLLRRP
jgi:GNAT superfamily N-acetyltransferase